MYRDAERCNLLLEENKLLKEMLYYRDINPMETPWKSCLNIFYGCRKKK